MEKRDKRKGLLGLLALLFGGGQSATVAGGLLASKALITGALLGVSTLAAGGLVAYNIMSAGNEATSRGVAYGSAEYNGGVEEFDREQQTLADGRKAFSKSSSLDYFKIQAKEGGILGFAGDKFVSDSQAMQAADDSLSDVYGSDVSAVEGQKMADAAASFSSSKMASSSSFKGFGSLDSASGSSSMGSMKKAAPLKSAGFASMKNRGIPTAAAGGARGGSLGSMGKQTAIRGSNARGAAGNSRTTLAQMQTHISKAVPMESTAASAQVSSAWDGSFGPDAGSLSAAGIDENGGGLLSDGALGSGSGSQDTSFNNSSRTTNPPGINPDDMDIGNPWDDIMKAIGILTLVAGAALLAANLLGKVKTPPWVAIAAIALAAVAIAAGAAIIVLGGIMGFKHGQWAVTLGTTVTGAFIIYGGIKAIQGALDTREAAAKELAAKTENPAATDATNEVNNQLGENGDALKDVPSGENTNVGGSEGADGPKPDAGTSDPKGSDGKTGGGKKDGGSSFLKDAGMDMAKNTANTLASNLTTPATAPDMPGYEFNSGGETAKPNVNLSNADAAGGGGGSGPKVGGGVSGAIGGEGSGMAAPQGGGGLSGPSDASSLVSRE